MVRRVSVLAGLGVGLSGVTGLIADTRVSAAPLSQPVVGDPTNSLRPQIAADGSNNLHMVWYDGGDNERAVKYAKGTFNGSGYSWSGPIDVYRPGGAPSFIHPRIAIDRGNIVHVVWSWRLNGVDTVLYKRWAAQENPALGVGPEVLGVGLLPSIAIDPDNHAHVVWEVQSSASNFEIVYRASNGTEFSASQNISNNNRESLSPDIAVDSNGQVHVVWYDKTPGAQTVLYTTRTGDSWSAAQPLSAPDSVFPAISADARGCVHLAWNEVSNASVVYRQSCNGQLSGSTVIKQGGQPRRPAIGSNAAGDVVVAWDDKVGSPTNVFYATLSNGAWSSPGQIAGSGANQLWADVAALPNGQIAVDWQENSGGQFDPAVRVVGPTPPAPTPPPSPAPTPPPAPPAGGAIDFANGDFRALWSRTDSLVQQGAVNYSWIWGPGPVTAAIGEYYVQSPGEVRTVQYFDKSRMEINQPAAPRDRFYVSNGRLTDELITGLRQVGDAQYEQHDPAAVAIAGDPDNTFPLYRDLSAVYRKPGGERANRMISRAPDGGVQISEVADTSPNTQIVQRVGNLGIPRVFWDWMNRSGPVSENGRVVTARPLFDWRYVIGEPLTEAYWTTVKVNGQQQMVLVQAFERRVLTYTPSNPGEFQIEMGNIGRHYFEWRYGTRP